MGGRGLPARHPRLERTLLEAGERLVRVPPRLTAPQRRRGRSARQVGPRSTRSPSPAPRCRSHELDSPRVGEETLRELKLLVDHRDDLVASGAAASNGCAGTCTSSTRSSQVPPGALDRTVWLDRLARQLARREQTTQTRIARDLSLAAGR